MTEIPKFANLPCLGQVLGCDTDPYEVDVDFSWTATDPFAISMLFKTDRITWCADTELFFRASADESDAWHGEGDISVGLVDRALYLMLQGSDGTRVLIKFSAIGLAPWLLRVRALQAANAGFAERLIHDELDALLQQDA